MRRMYDVYSAGLVACLAFALFCSSYGSTARTSGETVVEALRQATEQIDFNIREAGAKQRASGAAETDTERTDSAPDIEEDWDGWWGLVQRNLFYSVNNKILHNIVDLKDASVIYIDTAILNYRDIYAAYFSEQESCIAVEFSHDGGVSWKTTYIVDEEYEGVGSLDLSILDESNGYLLYCSDRWAGSKILYRTEDGGLTFHKMCDLTEMTDVHIADLAFCREDTGLILVSSNEEENYAYITEDGGETWEEYHIVCLDEDSYSNILGVDIRKGNDDVWHMRLMGILEDGQEALDFVSGDDWASWEVIFK